MKIFDPLEAAVAYLSPKKNLKPSDERNTVVLDTRNDYGYDLNQHFRGAPISAGTMELITKGKFMDKRCSLLYRWSPL